MRRLPIRLRLTAAFALAMVAVLAAAGAFAYLRVRSGLDETITESLDHRAAAVVRLLRDGKDPVPGPVAPELDEGAADDGEDAADAGEEEARGEAEEPEEEEGTEAEGTEAEGTEAEGTEPEEGDEEGFIQVLGRDGRVLHATPTAPRAMLDRAQLRRAAAAALQFERRVAGIEGPVRVLARAVSRDPRSPIVAVGQAVDDRHDTLSALLTAFALGGPVAILVASGVGYLLAAAALGPVEAMRQRAGQVSLADGDQRLPLPAADDEIRRLGETLNEMLDRLRRSFERERRFVADASHELRTPIAVIKTELEGALRNGDCGPGVRAALVAAVDECDSLAQLAEDLLVIARAADGQLPVRAERLRATAVLESVAQRFADRAAEHGRALRTEAPDDLQLHADPLRLRQALGNLVDNALRHGDGEITLVARARDAGVEIEVADAGRGFPPKLADQAFERFTRGSRARTRGGAGLGLAIVRAVIDAHGGRAAIVPGAGAKLRLWLPGQVRAAG